MSDCEQLRQHYDAYALGALEGEERAEIDVHLKRGCPICTADGASRATRVDSGVGLGQRCGASAAHALFRS